MSKIQTIAEYQQLASRTCTDLGDKLSNDRHMNLGVITEIGEVLDIFKRNLAYKEPIDTVNLGEELADISWYVVNKSTFYNFSLDKELFETVKSDVKQLIDNDLFTIKDLSTEIKIEALMVLLMKTYTGYNEDFFDAPIVQLAVLANIAEWFELDYFQCLTNNIDKLKVRYPEKFTEEAALNRDLKAERIELEKE